jgi:hypothetical protein
VEKAVNDLMVIAECTGRLGLVDAYDRQLSDAGIDHSFDTVPFATSSFNMGARIRYWRNLAIRFSEYKIIIVTDAWDVLFFGTKQEVLDKCNVTRPIISAERNCFPGLEFGYEDLTNSIMGSTPWKYCNPGMLVASPKDMLMWLDEAESFGELEKSDQAWFNLRRSELSSIAVLDTTTNLFYVISYNDGRLEDESLQIKDGRLWNSRCDTFPNFFHFAGHGPMEARRVLPGHGAPRYRTMRLIREYIESR